MSIAEIKARVSRWRRAKGHEAIALYHSFNVKDVDRLIRALELLRGVVEKNTRHRECEDSWYSCPLSEEGCADETQTECNCSATYAIDALAAIDKILGE